MAQDGASEVSVSELPDPVKEWLTDIASRRDLSVEDVLARLVAETDRALAVDDGELSELRDRLDDLESRLDALEAESDEDETTDTESLEARIDELDSELDEKISDVRDRVIQVKREADRKAPKEHDHPDLRTELDDVEGDLDRIEERLGELDEAVSDDSIDTEALHEEFQSTAEELNRKLNILGSALLSLRGTVSEMSTERARRAAVNDLQETANHHGVRTASCESCDTEVDIGLLTDPNCPHCGEGFAGLDPKRGFFGSNTLRTGTPPALEGEVPDEEGDALDDIIEE